MKPLRIASIVVLMCVSTVGSQSLHAYESASSRTAPLAHVGLEDIAARGGADLWFTESTRHRIGRITSSGTITEFPVPRPLVRPFHIIYGPDNKMWFTEADSTRIGYLRLGDFAEGEVTIKVARSQPAVIANGPDARLWFTDAGANKIGRMRSNGTLVEYALPTANSGPLGITHGLTNSVWFTEATANKIGRINLTVDSSAVLTTMEGKPAEFPLPTAHGRPEDICSGPYDDMWFTDALGDHIGRITRAGRITLFPLPPGSHPRRITGDYTDNVWFTEPGTNKIGRLSGKGQLTEFRLPTLGSVPQGIAVGAYGIIWFTEQGSDKIGRITPTGKLTEFSVLPAPR